MQQSMSELKVNQSSSAENLVAKFGRVSTVVNSLVNINEDPTYLTKIVTQPNQIG